MAVAGDLYKLVFGGRLCLTEQWTCSMHVLGTQGQREINPLLFTALTEWFRRGTSQINNQAYLDFVKWNQINPLDGKYVNQDTVEAYWGQGALSASPPLMGGGDSAGDPATSFCVSTTTALRRGRGSKGRFYPPTAIDSANWGVDGRANGPKVLAMAVSAAQLLTDINGAVDGSLVVFSSVGQLTQEILGVRVGRTNDIQTRRRRNIVEDYQPALIS